jgi:hypothetical protein
MSPALVQRGLALAAVVLLIVLAGLAIASSRDDSHEAKLPERVGDWYDARAAPMSSDLEGTTTACGVRLTANTMGIADPVLPCGAKLYLSFGGEDVLTQVIATGPSPRGVRFALSPALADSFGIENPVGIRWSYAR